MSKEIRKYIDKFRYFLINEEIRYDINHDLITVTPRNPGWSDIGVFDKLYDTELNDIITWKSPAGEKETKNGYFDKKNFIIHNKMTEKTFSLFLNQGYIKSPDYLWHHYRIKGKGIMCVIMYTWTKNYYKPIYLKNKEKIDKFLSESKSVSHFFDTNNIIDFGILYITDILKENDFYIANAISRDGSIYESKYILKLKKQVNKYSKYGIKGIIIKDTSDNKTHVLVQEIYIK